MTTETSEAPAKAVVFCACAEKDLAYCDELQRHVATRPGWCFWGPRSLLPGLDAEEQTLRELGRASVIVLLVSADFLADDFLADKLLPRALERGRDGATLLPVKVRAVNLGATLLAGLHALPSRRDNISAWKSRDEAWQSVLAAMAPKRAVAALSAQGLLYPVAAADMVAQMARLRGRLRLFVGLSVLFAALLVAEVGWRSAPKLMKSANDAQRLAFRCLHEEELRKRFGPDFPAAADVVRPEFLNEALRGTNAEHLYMECEANHYTSCTDLATLVRTGRAPAALTPAMVEHLLIVVCNGEGPEDGQEAVCRASKNVRQSAGATGP